MRADLGSNRINQADQVRHGLSAAQQSEMISADPSSIAKIEGATPEAQLQAIASRIDLYWKILEPCDDATTYYLKRRPYEIDRFAGVSDDIKARVLIAKPDLIYAWIKQGYLKSPVEPDGFHEAIIRELLRNIKYNAAYGIVLKTIYGMRKAGYQWSEFNAMETSLHAAREEERNHIGAEAI